jgi:hypothetical protein
MVTAIFTKTYEELQYITQPNPASQSYILDTRHKKRRAKVIQDTDNDS